MDSLALSCICGGLPFIDANFQSSSLLTAVAVVRRHHHACLGGPLRPLSEYAWQPEFVYRASRTWMGTHDPVESTPLDAARQSELQSAIEDIVQIRPDWSS